MYYAPHKLYLGVATKVNNSVVYEYTYLCDCFMHDVDTKIKEAYAGQGISTTHYVNMDRRDDLKINLRVQVRAGDTILAENKIVDVKNTYGMGYASQGNYTVIYI